jgi:hypothetical protein
MQHLIEELGLDAYEGDPETEGGPVTDPAIPNTDPAQQEPAEEEEADAEEDDEAEEAEAETDEPTDSVA